MPNSNMLEEVWQSIAGYEGHYEVSSFGRVRTLKYKKADPCLSTIEHPKTGYLQVQLWLKQKPKTRLVHQLVALAFLGPPPKGQQVRHKDGGRGNARLDNLEYGTPAQNAKDKEKHGTKLYGDKHPRTRTPDVQVLLIRERHKNGERMSLLAKEYGISLSSVKNYVSGVRQII